MRWVTSSVSPAWRGMIVPAMKRAEDQRDADLLGRERGQQHHGEDRGDPRHRDAPGLVVGPRDARHQRAHADAHDQAEGDRQQDGAHDVEAAARGGHGRGQGDEEPGADVVDGGAGQRQRADRLLEHAPLDQDPRQHREGGDRHRDAHEEREGGEAALGRRADQGVGRQRHGDAREHRDRDAGVGDRRGLCHAPAQLREVELEPDEEHVEDQPEVGRDADERDDVAREEGALQVGEEQSEDRRPEEDPGEHLPHHARLAEVRDRRPHEPCEEHDHDDGQEEGGDRLGEVALLGRDDLLGRGAGPGGGQVQGDVAVERLPGDRAHALVATGQAPGDGTVAVDQAPEAALDLVGAAGLLELERAAQAVRARRELVGARDRRRRARAQGAGRGRVALELGAQRGAAERPEEHALHGDRGHERALAAAGTAHVALQAPVAQPRT